MRGLRRGLRKDELGCSLVRVSAVRECSTRTRHGHGRVLSVRCYAVALLSTAGLVRSMLILKLVHRIYAGVLTVRRSPRAAYGCGLNVRCCAAAC